MLTYILYKEKLAECKKTILSDKRDVQDNHADKLKIKKSIAKILLSIYNSVSEW